MLAQARQLHAGSLRSFETGSLGEKQARQVEHGLDAYATAGRIVDDPASGLVDLAGALVLLSTAARDLDAVERAAAPVRGGLGRRGGAEPRRLCVFDPTHGESTADVRDADRAGGARVPACAACAADLQGGRTPDWLYDGAQPYVETDSVWAQTLFGTVGEDLVTQLQRRQPST